MNDDAVLRSLRELDEGTDWEQSGDLLAANDQPEEDTDDGLGGVRVMLPAPDRDDGGEGLAADEEELGGIIEHLTHMVTAGIVEDLLIIVNDTDFDMSIITTIGRNDLVLGCLETAKLNWFNTQLSLQGSGEEDYDED